MLLVELPLERFNLGLFHHSCSLAAQSFALSVPSQLFSPFFSVDEGFV
jgi:hypothetical protein